MPRRTRCLAPAPPPSNAHASESRRPVLVPPCTVSPFRSRATTLTSTPCQFSVCSPKLLDAARARRPARPCPGPRLYRPPIVVAAAVRQPRIDRRRDAERRVVRQRSSTGCRPYTSCPTSCGSSRRSPRRAACTSCWTDDAQSPVVRPRAPAGDEAGIEGPVNTCFPRFCCPSSPHSPFFAVFAEIAVRHEVLVGVGPRPRRADGRADQRVHVEVAVGRRDRFHVLARG